MALEVPAYSSLPSANHTIYLDFDGHTTINDQWNIWSGVNAINSPAYSEDNNYTAFTATELINIKMIWARVTEDFAPFNVNVTTVEPSIDDLRNSGGSDTRWGIRVVITDDVAFGGNYGGYAYPGSFIWSTDTPAFVFNQDLLGIAEVVMSEATSKVVGISLGLNYDGVVGSSNYIGHGIGATSWAPIMGTSHFRSVTQWDNGEFFNATSNGPSANFGRGPDDLAVITTYNGFGYRPDTVGDTLVDATPLTVSGSSVSAAGIIEKREDIDVYSFITGAGPVSINVNPAMGANLDIKADLYNSAGNLVMTANNLAALNATLDLTLPEDIYYLKVDGVGVGNPLINPPTGYTDYGSIGQYRITGSIVPPIGSAVSVYAIDAQKAEGNAGTTAFTFTVARSGNLSQPATVNFTVAGIGSTPATPADFPGGLLPSQTITFASGVPTYTVTVNVRGDTAVENDDMFTVTLSNPSNGMMIATASATGVIKNDDFVPTEPTFSIGATNLSRFEGTGGSPTQFTFSVSRSGPFAGATHVRYSVTGSGSNPANSADFVGGFPTNVLVGFTQNTAAALITLNVVPDSGFEPNEGFRVTLSSPVGGTIAVGSVDGLIKNDDIYYGNTVKSSPDSDPDDTQDPSEETRGKGDAVLGRDLIMVALPLWASTPPQYLTAADLDVPVVTWINGVPHIGDRAPAVFDELRMAGRKHDEADFDSFEDFDFVPYDSADLGPDESFAGESDYDRRFENGGEFVSLAMVDGRTAKPWSLGGPTVRPAAWLLLDAAIIEESNERESSRADAFVDPDPRDGHGADELTDDALADWSAA